MYYASTEKKKSNYHTTYYVNTTQGIVNRTLQTKGHLEDLVSVTQEQYLKWRISLSHDDWQRQKEYVRISKFLADFGHDIRRIYANGDHSEIPAEKRKLKDFEEKAFLNGINSLEIH